MNVTLAYRGRSGVADTGSRRIFHLVPNLARDPVAFDAPLLQPLRFREAMSALHDIVINDLRYKPRDKTAYEQWKKDQQGRLSTVRREGYRAALEQIEARRGAPLPTGFEKQFQQLRKKYW